MTDLNNAVKTFRSKRDVPAFQTELGKLAAGFCWLSRADAVDTCAQVRNLFMEDYFANYRNLSLEKREKEAELIANAFAAQPKLIDSIAHALVLSAEHGPLRDHDNDTKKVPFFESFRAIPQMESALDFYINALLHDDRPALEASNIFTALKDTGFIEIASPSHVSHLISSAESYIDENDVEGFSKMSAIPHVWGMIEQRIPDLFCAFTHAVNKDELPFYIGDVGDRYTPELSESGTFLTITFNQQTTKPKPATSDWVDKLDEDCFEPAYTLLAHTVGVLKDSRIGRTTDNVHWIGHQQKILLPLLEADVNTLEKNLVALGIPVPYIPNPVIPPGQQRGVSINWAAHRAFRHGP